MKFFNKHQLDESAFWMTEAIMEAFESSCKSTPMYSTSKAPWWGKELAKLRTAVRRAFNKARNSRKQIYWEAYRAAQKEYNKAIKITKRKSWRTFCASIETAHEASRLCKILSKNKHSHLGCLEQTDGRFTCSLEESLKLLMDTHFPGSSSLADTNPENSLSTQSKHKPKA